MGRLQVGVALAVATIVLLGAGCVSRTDIYSEVAESRAASFRTWLAEAQREDLPELQGELSVADAVRVALAYNKTLERVELEKERARGELWTAYSEVLPSLDASANYTRLDQVFNVDLGVQSFQIGSKDNWQYRLDFVQPLFKGGAIPAAIRGARVFQVLSDENVREAVQDVILSTSTAYYNVLLAQHLVDVQEDALRFARANLEDVQARAEQGVAIRYDVLRAELEVSNVQADLIQQRNELSEAMTNLFRTMGVSQESDVELVGELDYEPMEADFQEAVGVAFRNRPDLYQAELDRRLQREGLRAVLSRYWPQLEAFAWHLWAKPDPHEASNIGWDDQWQAGVRLRWPLFDGLEREGEVIQQRAVLRQAEVAVLETEQAVLEEVLNAILALDYAEELVESQRLNLVQANEALRLVRIGAREGVNTELEVLDARAALTRTSGLYYQALHAHTVARIRLQRATGRLGPEPGVTEMPQTGPEIGMPEFVPAEAPATPPPADEVEDVDPGQGETPGAPEPQTAPEPEEGPPSPRRPLQQ